MTFTAPVPEDLAALLVVAGLPPSGLTPTPAQRKKSRVSSTKSGSRMAAARHA